MAMSESNQPERITDERQFALSLGMIGSLSRYADSVSSAVLAGKADMDLTVFISEVRARFATLSRMALESISPEERVFASEMIGSLPESDDPVSVALACDQAFMYLQSFLQQDAFMAHIRLASVRAGLEEANARAALDRLGARPSGLYM